MTRDEWTMLAFALFVLAVWVYFIADRVRYRVRCGRRPRAEQRGFEVIGLPHDRRE
jgi:hypothetical protein